MRQPPYRKQQVERLAKAVLATRSGLVGHAGGCKLIPGDMVFFKDAGKPMLADAFWRMLLNNTKGRLSKESRREHVAKNSVHVLMAESCLKERRGRLRSGVAALKQLAGLHCFTNMETVVPTVERNFLAFFG